MGVLKVTSCVWHWGLNRLNGSTMTHRSDHGHSRGPHGTFLRWCVIIIFSILSHHWNVFENIKAFFSCFLPLKFQSFDRSSSQFFADNAALCTDFSTRWEPNIPFRGGNWILKSVQCLSERSCTRASCCFATLSLWNNVKEPNLRKSNSSYPEKPGETSVSVLLCTAAPVYGGKDLELFNKSYGQGDVLPDLTKCEIALAK